MATTKRNETVTEKRRKKDHGDGNVHLRSDGRWRAKILIDGIEKYLYGKTEAEVKRKLKDYKKFKAQGHVDAKKAKLNEYIEFWLYTIVLPNVKNPTFDRYESTYIHHIKDTIGKLQLASVNAKLIQELIDAKMGRNDERGYCKEDGKPLSRSSVVKIRDLLYACFKYAVKHKDMYENPVELVTLPKKEYYPVKQKEPRALTDEEMQAIKAVADATRKNGNPVHRYAWLLMVILNTGLRVNEMVAVEWDDIDFDKRIMKIYKAVESNVKIRDEYGRSTGKRHSPLSGTKTEDGMRVVSLSDTAIYYLTKLKEYADNKKIKTKYVSYTDKGTRTSDRNLQRTLDLVTEKANIAHTGLHELRHTFGSTLVRKGVDISVVSSMMGHKNIHTTYKHYIHILQEQKAEAVKLLDVIETEET